MAKNDEATLRKIRKDIPIASAELEAIRRDVEVANKELLIAQQETKNAQALTESERSKVSIIWESTARKLQLTQAVHESLAKDNAEKGDKLAFTRAQLTLMQNLLHDTIVRLTEASKREPKGMVAGLIKAMHESLNQVVSQRKSESETLVMLQAERTKLQESVAALSAQEATFAGKVEEKLELEAKMLEMQKELANADEMVKDIQRRDHDSAVMAMRMTKEYQDVYFKATSPQE